jgi:integrase
VKASRIDPGGVVMHTLRHTVLARWMDAGLDVGTIMEISGHASMAMLECYTHPTEQCKAEAVQHLPNGHNRRWRSKKAPAKPGSKAV